MARSLRILAGLLVALAPLPIRAQQAIRLTGTPQATLANPFTSVSAVRELSATKAVVVDNQDKAIVVADFAKNRVDSVGRHGGGPGEYQMPVGAFGGPAGVTWVPDPMLGRVHVVSPEGKIKDAIALDASGGMMFPRGADAAGRFYSLGQPSFNRSGSGQVDSLPLVRWDPASKRMDTLAWLPQGGTATVSSTGNSRSFSMRIMPFSPVVAWGAFADGRVAIAHPDPYRIDIVDARGQLHKGPVNPFTPVRIGAKERAATREAMKNSKPMVIVRGNGGNVAPPPGALQSQELKDEDFPPTMPPFQGSSLLIDPTGLVWVLRNRPADDPTPAYDLFDGTGRMVGKATLKPHSTVVGFGQGMIYVARQNPDDDLVYLEKYVRPGGGDTNVKPLGGGK